MSLLDIHDKIDEYSKYGYSFIARVDLHLPDEYHDLLMEYPLMIVKRKPLLEELSPLQLLHKREPKKEIPKATNSSPWNKSSSVIWAAL